MRNCFKTSFKSLSMRFLVPAFLLVAGFSGGATNEEVQRLKMLYEQKYQQYNQSLQNAKDRTAETLSREVQAAKAAYDEAKSRLSIVGDKVGEKIDKVVSKVETILNTTAATGNGSTTLPIATGAVSLNYKELTGRISGDNYCGQYAMSVVLQGLGLTIEPQKVYLDSNPRGIFTAPSTAMEYLNANGAPSHIKNQASLADVKAKLDAGQPVMVLVNSSGSPHWIVLTGYQTDASGQMAKLEVWSNGHKTTYDAQSFLKNWAQPLGDKTYAKLVGYQNLMIDIQKPNGTAKTPLYTSNFWTATEDNIAGAVNDTVTGWKNKKPFQVVGGVLKGVTGLGGAVISVSGSGLQMVGEKMSSWGKTRWADGSLGGKVMGGAAVVAGIVSRGVGTGARFIGNVASSCSTLLGNGFKKLGSILSL